MKPTSQNSQLTKANSKNQDLEIKNLSNLTSEKLRKRVEMFHRYNNLPSNIFPHDFKKIATPKKTNKFFQIFSPFRWRLFWKTFFSSWSTLLSFVLLALFITSGLSAMFLSQYWPTQHIGKDFEIPRDFVLNLPSSLSPLITKKLDSVSDADFISQIQRLAEVHNFGFALTQGDTYTFDVYEFLRLLSNQKFFSLLGTNNLGEDIFTKTLFSIFSVFGFWLLASFLEMTFGLLIGLWVRLSGRKWSKKVVDVFVSFFSSLPFLLYFLFVSYLWGVSFYKTLIIIIAIGWIVPFKMSYEFFSSFEDSLSSLKTTKLRILISKASIVLFPKLITYFFARLWEILFLLTALGFFGITLSSGSYDFGTIIRDGIISFNLNSWSFFFPLIVLYFSFVIFKFFEHSLLKTMKITARRL